MLSHRFSALFVFKAILLVSLMTSFGFMPSGSAPGMANAAPNAPGVPPPVDIRHLQYCWRYGWTAAISPRSNSRSDQQVGRHASLG